ncbi:MAG: CAP domain-containing protein [Isosphaeraceae bacterium]
MPFKFAFRDPRVMTRLPLAVVVVGCAALDPWPRMGPIVPVPRLEEEDHRSPALDPARVTKDLVVLHNRVRAQAKLHSLEPSRKLQAAAEEHVRDMAARHKMTHEGSDGSSPASRISNQAYRFRRCGENVAFGVRTCEAVMKGWMESPPHKANILGNFSQIGAAYATALDGTPFWCVTFGLPARRK